MVKIEGEVPYENPYKVLVIFGSQSDKEVYEPICKILEEKKINHKLVIASAHKSPELVDKAVDEEEYKVIIAGAGLAAALPGVIAAKVLLPVIGVPCEGNYQGLDALLSIMQMPPGIPVLTVGVNNAKEAAVNAIKMLTQYEDVNIIGDSSHKKVKRVVEIMEQFDNKFKVSDAIENDALNIKFVELGEKIKEEDALIIYCPLDDNPKDTKANAALNLIHMAKDGLWVGLNNGENAGIAAIEIMNLDERNLEGLGHYRGELRKKFAKK